MARGINKVIIIGNLGSDPEMAAMPNSTSVAKLSVATSETWKDKNTGEAQERTEWHRVIIFGALADIAGKYLKKGSKIYIEGSLKTRKWQDKNSGQDRWATEIIGKELNMLDTQQNSNGQGNQGQHNQAVQNNQHRNNNQQNQPAQNNQHHQHHQGNQQGNQGQPNNNNNQSNNNNGYDPFDDDIPF